MESAKELARLEFRYHSLPVEERERLLDKVRGELLRLDDIVFAYAHGSILKGEFRDIDIAVWVRDPDKSFDYTVHLSVRLESEIRKPVDIHVLNGAPLPFRYHVFTEGRLLLSRCDEMRIREVDKTVRMYLDIKEVWKRIGS